MTPDKLTKAALACIKAGLSIVPIDHRTKRPFCQLLPKDNKGKPHWEPYQRQIVDEDTLGNWPASGIQSFAVVGGKVSGGLLVLDFDVERFYFAWREAAGELADGLPVQRTGGGKRYQIFLRCKDPGGNDKLAWVADEQEQTGRTVAIETRGEGGYAIVPPSLHPSGNRYEMVAGSLSEIPEVPQARADALLAAARKLDECPHTRQERERREQQARETHKKRSNRNDGHGSVIDAFNAAHPIEDMLEAHGYSRGARGRYVRPGGKSESVSIKDGQSCHWSSNDPLNDGRVSSGCGVHDAFGVYCYYEHGGDQKEAVKAAAALLGLRGANGHKPSCLRSVAVASVPPVGPFMSLPLDALPEPVRSFVAGAARAIGCDPSYVALPVLAGLASAIGNSRRIQLKKGWSEPAVVWAAIVGDSGTLKSPALEVALRPVRKRQHATMRQFAEAMAKYELELMHHAKELAAWKKSKDDSDPPTAPEEPYAERCWCDDTTVEALAVLLLQNPRGLLLVRDELAGWLGSFDRYTGGRGADAPKYLEMFGGRPIVVDRKTGASRIIYVPRAAVSVVGGIQPAILRRALGEAHRENGLAARLLLACPPRQAKRWTEDEISPGMESRMERIFDKLYSLQLVMVGEGEPRPLDLPLTPGAKEAWINFYNAHAEEQAELTGDLAATWSKLEGYAARLALVTHLVRGAAGDQTLENPNIVDERSIEAGVELSAWFGYEARRVYAILNETDEQRDYRRLVEMIRCKHGAVTGRDLQRSSRTFPTTEAATDALEKLVEAGLGRWDEPKPGPAGGRPSRRFVLADGVDVDKTSENTGRSGVLSTSAVSTTAGDDWGVIE